ncbi:MAG: TetR/AcrR family transcriptional regulator [Bauldia sp.]|nr:TetR/AcrR family transcriptional regulator [Bauldia sp.]
MSIQANAINETRKRKPRGHGHERRGEILAVAKELFASEGFETVTTRKLAERAGISQTGLYVYFQSKEEIMEALCREAFGHLIAGMQKAARETPLGPERLKRLGEAYIAFGLDYPEEYQLVFMSSLDGTPFIEQKDFGLPFEEQPPGMQAFLICYEQICELAAAGFLKRDDTLVVTQTVWMASHGLVSLLIARPQFPWADKKALIASVTETLVAGLTRDGVLAPETAKPARKKTRA